MKVCKKPSPPPPKGQGCPVPQDPTACTCRPPPTKPFQPPKRSVLSPAEINRHLCQCSTHEQPASHIGPDLVCTAKTQRASELLLRKEVIQPHLPVRLPCYDLVLITDPTFDGSLPQGVRPPASGVTDFHDLTGGVYKARERIHRSVADLRLLATPTS